MERIEYFNNVMKYAEEIKKIVSDYLNEFEIYIFGSAVTGDFSPGLSDIDVAIVSDEFEDREKKMKVYDILLEKYFESPFEFHLLSMKRWEFYMRFINNEVIKIC